MRHAYLHFNIHHSYLEKVFFLSNYTFTTEKFRCCLYRGKQKSSAASFCSCLTTRPRTTVSTKSDLTKIEQLSHEFPDFYYCLVGKGWYCKVCVSFADVPAPNIPCVSTAGFFADHKTRNSTIHLNSQRYQEALKNKKKL